MSPGMDPDYVDVAERIREFYDKYPQGSLQAIVDGVPMEVAGRFYVKYVAAAYRSPDDKLPGIGTAWELVPGPTPFTKNSELQNAETSAWGRAIVACGIPSKKIATAQDVEKSVAADRASQSSPQARASRAATSEPSRARASGGADPPSATTPPVAGVELPPDPLVRATDDQWREIKQIGLDLGRRIGADEAAVRYAKLLDELRPLNPASLTEAEADRLIVVLKKEAAQYKVPA